jgi:hypothetical protein
LIALWGAVTGTLAQLEDRRTDIDVESRDIYVATGSGRPIEVAIINKSRHSTQFTGGKVLLAGKNVGFVTDLVPPTTTDPLPSSVEPTSTSAVPITIPAETSVHGFLLWVPERDVASRFQPDKPQPKDPLKVLGKLNGKLLPLKLELELDFSPGHAKKTRVDVQPSDEALITERAHARGMVSGFRADAPLQTGRRVGRISVHGPSPNGPGVATLKLWTRSSKRAIATITRPYDNVGAEFTLPRLKPGTYEFVVTVNGQGVGAGTFRTPCADGVGQDPAPSLCSEPDSGP